MPVLDARSLEYVESLNTGGSTGVWASTKDSALTQLQAALNGTGEFSEEQSHFLIDYYNDSNDANTDFKNWLRKADHVPAFLAAKLPLTAPLAAVLADTNFAAAADVAKTLNTALLNTQDAKQPPPAIAISTLGNITVTMTGVTNLGGKTALQYNRDLARGYAETYLQYALDNQLPISADLVDAYVSLDPASAGTWIAGKLTTQLQADKAVPTVLMDAYRQLNPNGPGGPALAAGALDPAFGSTSPLVSGWARLALEAQTDRIDAGLPAEEATLAQLDAINPWAAAYVRWHSLMAKAPTGQLDSAQLAALNIYDPKAANVAREAALRAQAAAHRNLNTDYLQALAKYDPLAAVTLINQALGGAVPSRNALASTSDTGKSTADGLTNDTTPTVRVYLDGMGSPSPAAGAIVKLFADGSTAAVAQSSPLTGTDITNGYVDLTSSVLTTGRHSFTSSFTSTAAGVTTTSPSSIPLVVDIDNTGPTLTGGEYYLGPTKSIVLEFDEPGGLDLTGLTQNDFQVEGLWSPTGAWGALSLVGITLDEAGGQVGLAIASGTGTLYSQVRVTVTAAGKSKIRDLAGNGLPGTTPTITLTPNNALVMPTASTVSASAPATVPRALDTGAWNILNQLNPALAKVWKDAYTAAGLVPEETASGSDDDGLSPEEIMEMDVETALWMVFTGRASRLEEQLKQQITITQQKNEAMSKLNELLGTLNKMAAAVPADAKATDPIKDKIGAKYADLATEVDTAITASGVKPFNTTDGKLNNAITKGDLDGAIQQLKGQIDSLGNNQQAEMLRLQGLNSRFNECHVILTNHMEKASNVREKIVDNTR